MTGTRGRPNGGDRPHTPRAVGVPHRADTHLPPAARQSVDSTSVSPPQPATKCLAVWFNMRALKVLRLSVSLYSSPMGGCLSRLADVRRVAPPVRRCAPRHQAGAQRGRVHQRPPGACPARARARPLAPRRVRPRRCAGRARRPGFRGRRRLAAGLRPSNRGGPVRPALHPPQARLLRELLL
jgi:hypothetical protein